jgi:hypothetical protein
MSSQLALELGEPVYAPMRGIVQPLCYAVARRFGDTDYFLLTDGTWCDLEHGYAKDYDFFEGCQVHANRVAARHPGAFIVRCQ